MGVPVKHIIPRSQSKCNRNDETYDMGDKKNAAIKLLIRQYPNLSSHPQS